MSNINISISAETIFHLGPVPITNSIFTSWIVSLLIIAIALWASMNVRYTKRPRGLQNVLEMIVDALYGLTMGITESTKKTTIIFPFVLSFFIFIILNNYSGLLPGVGTIGFYETHQENSQESSVPQIKPIAAVPVAYASTEAPAETGEAVTTESSENSAVATAAVAEARKVWVPLFRAGTSDLNTTLALALVSCFATWFYGFKILGTKGYLSKFKNPLEIISEFSRLISFTFRLFGNIFAGEVLIIVMTALVPIIVPSVFYGLELFVGAIQAFVFSILTLAFMNLAMQAHGDGAHEQHA